jgi:hypothetical protein
MLEQFELFKEGLPDDEDKRLHYLRFIREFKDNNPKEFKRIICCFKTTWAFWLQP